MKKPIKTFSQRTFNVSNLRRSQKFSGRKRMKRNKKGRHSILFTKYLQLCLRHIATLKPYVELHKTCTHTSAILLKKDWYCISKSNFSQSVA